MKIGIGIPTYDRLESLKLTVKSLRAYTDIQHDLCVVIDGSSDLTKDWLIDNHVDHIFHEQNRGVCYAKNKILQKFRDYDYIFIIEDDVRLVKHGLLSLYIRAIKVFHIQHWNFLAPWQRESRRPNMTRNGLTMMFSKKLGGALSVYTKKVIEKVGAFNPQFKGYGYGHCEYTLRAHRAGLTTPWNEFAHLVDAEDYVVVLPHGGLKSREQREEERKANLIVLRKSLQDKKLIHIPFEDIVRA